MPLPGENRFPFPEDERHLHKDEELSLEESIGALLEQVNLTLTILSDCDDLGADHEPLAALRQIRDQLQTRAISEAVNEAGAMQLLNDQFTELLVTWPRVRIAWEISIDKICEDTFRGRLATLDDAAGYRELSQDEIQNRAAWSRLLAEVHQDIHRLRREMARHSRRRLR